MVMAENCRAVWISVRDCSLSFSDVLSLKNNTISIRVSSTTNLLSALRVNCLNVHGVPNHTVLVCMLIWTLAVCLCSGPKLKAHRCQEKALLCAWVLCSMKIDIRTWHYIRDWECVCLSNLQCTKYNKQVLLDVSICDRLIWQYPYHAFKLSSLCIKEIKWI